MQTPNAYRLGYRGDIEGLRAVAILLVVAAHAKVVQFAGGFIGVDVFFVLSGYLITGLLVQEILVNRTLNFSGFYARRLRRLLPGLLLMLLCTSLLGRLLIAPDQQMDQANAAAAASLWLSNFLFAFGNLDYFSPGADTNLFLHTWSLGVEEQFYLAWPLLLMLALGAWTGADRRPDLRHLKPVMLGLLAISFTLCLVWTRTKPLFAFYMMPARAWQFALGALVFLMFGAPDTPAGSAPSGGSTRIVGILRWSGWLGLIAIVAAALLIDGKVPYPGAWAVLPAIGAAAILASGAHAPGSGVGRVLSWRPMQAIGRVSYAWYLWHWPVLLLGATLVNMDSGWNRTWLVALSLAIGALSYHFVETPIRRNPWLPAKPRVAIVAAIALMILCNALSLRWHNGARDRMASPEQMRYQQVKVDAPAIYGMGCDDWYFSAEVKICAFGPADAAHTAVAIGDSVALQWFPAYAEIFDKPDWRLLVATKSSCPMVDEPFFYARIGREFSECAQWRRDALQKIAALKPDIIILGSTYTTDYTNTQWIEGTARILQALAPSSRHIYIMRSTPIMPFDGPSCLEPRSWLYLKLSQRAQCVAPAQNIRSNDVYRWLSVAASRFHNVSLIDMTDAICPDGQCQAERNGMIVFRDSQHLSTSFSQSLGAVLSTRLDLNTRAGATTSQSIPQPPAVPQSLP